LENDQWHGKPSFAGAVISIDVRPTNSQTVLVVMEPMNAMWRVKAMLVFSRLLLQRENAAMSDCYASGSDITVCNVY
jgi:hypothetical protein